MTDPKGEEAVSAGGGRIGSMMPLTASVGCSSNGDTGLKRCLSGLKICRIATVPYFMVFQLKSQAEYLRDLGIQVVLVVSGPRNGRRCLRKSASVWRRGFQ
jgi:hypothetical protein